MLASTDARKVVLVGNSRGGNTIRNYVQNGGGDKVVSHVVLGGNPAHGIWSIAGFNEGSEFSARSHFIRQLNAPKGPGGDEVTPGVQWLTLRSDSNDKYAQPDGRWIGEPGTPTHVGYDGPALKGATNVVLPGVDHRETSFSPAAFCRHLAVPDGQRAPHHRHRAGGRLIALDGRSPASAVEHRPGQRPVHQQPAAGRRALAVYAVDGDTGERTRRRGAPQGRSAPTAAGDRWREARGTPYEFVIAAAGYATTHIYRSRFRVPRRVVNCGPNGSRKPIAMAPASSP